MTDWKDNILLMNSMTAKAFAPFVPPMPINRDDLVLIEKTMLQSQLQLVQGLEQLIKNRMRQIETDPPSSTEKAKKIKVS